MADAQIDVRNVSKSFKRNGRTVQAIDGLNLSIQDGQFVSFVGASGCGKSTFLRMLDGLSPTTSGSIEINGAPVNRPGRERAFVFQQDRMLPWRTVLDNVAFGLEVQGKKKKEARAAAMELLTVVGLARFANSHPGELSGGMRQRANLARAYAVEPKILLMDEPYAALDGQTREMMQAWLMETWEASKRTVLFVTHQIDEAVYLSDRVIVMTARPGRVKADIAIDLPRPRTLAVKRTPEFSQYIDQIWSLIEEEVKESMNLEMQMGASS
ncbi:ABC transporter ATP-binding protein [Arthrobacter ginkgonis]|uniref:ABC transporter ATP-binding protein n=1 Tax=Arthrobacter ginkgonis TaxID=1630594 RepID=A0ABP7BU60_9MICC